MFQVSDHRRHGESDIHRDVLTACPRLSGLISKKARVFSLSKSLKQGISPSRVSDLYIQKITRIRTLDDTTKNTGRHDSGCSREVPLFVPEVRPSKVYRGLVMDVTIVCPTWVYIHGIVSHVV